MIAPDGDAEPSRSSLRVLDTKLTPDLSGFILILVRDCKIAFRVQAGEQHQRVMPVSRGGRLIQFVKCPPHKWFNLLEAFFFQKEELRLP